jgi:hypothetical protein
MTCSPTSTPPSTVFVADGYYAAPKNIRVYSGNGHEGRGIVHVRTHISPPMFTTPECVGVTSGGSE